MSTATGKVVVNRAMSLDGFIAAPGDARYSGMSSIPALPAKAAVTAFAMPIRSPATQIGAAVFPLIAVLFYPSVLAVTLPAAVAWAAVTQLVLHRGPRQARQPTGGTWWSHS